MKSMRWGIVLARPRRKAPTVAFIETSQPGVVHVRLPGGSRSVSMSPMEAAQFSIAMGEASAHSAKAAAKERKR